MNSGFDADRCPTQSSGTRDTWVRTDSGGPTVGGRLGQMAGVVAQEWGKGLAGEIPDYASLQTFSSGQRVGEWILDNRIAGGPFTEVWLAQHCLWQGLQGAVKVATRPEATPLLRREAATLLALGSPEGHPNIYVPLAADDKAPPSYMVTRYVDAPTMRKRVISGGFSTPDALHISRQIADALQHAHSKHILHADLKPENILIGDKMHVTLIDFSHPGPHGAFHSIDPWLSVHDRKTLDLAGTMAYLAPEERQGLEVDERTDIFHFGLVLHEIFTGRLPDGDHEPPGRLNPSLDGCWRDLFAKCTCSRSHRIPSGEALLHYFDAKMSMPPSQRYRRAAGAQTSRKSHGKKSWHSPSTVPTSADTCSESANNSPNGAVVMEKPKPILVTPTGEGGFPTISQAIEAAGDGGCVKVAPGVYSESLVIRKNISIVGDGTRDQITIRSDQGPCVHVCNGAALIQGIRLRCPGLGNEHPALSAAAFITRGTLHLKDCDVWSERPYCLRVEGSAASLNATGCRVWGARTGVLYANGATGTIEGTHVHNVSQSGIAVTSCAYPRIRNCQIYDSEGDGVCVADGGCLTLEDSDIYRVVTGLSSVGAQTNPTVVEARIRDCTSRGIFVGDGSDGTFSDCAISDIIGGGIYIERLASPLIRGCTVDACQKTGITIQDNGRGTVSGCRVKANCGDGVLVASGGVLTIDQCEIRSNGGAGITVAGAKSFATVENSRSLGNAKGPTHVCDGGRIKTHRNIFSFWERILGSFDV